VTRAPRRKPPKHLPKAFPDGHPLRDEMTPQEWVGQRLVELWRQEGEEKQANWVHDWTPNVRKPWAKANRVDVERRSSWLASHGEDHLAEVEQAIHTDRGVPHSPDDGDDPAYEAIREIRKQEPARIITPPRPKGAWKFIFAQVGAEVEQQYRMAISNRTLKRCLHAYRRLEDEIEQSIDLDM
jgi:hypothetical protein